MGFISKLIERLGLVTNQGLLPLLQLLQEENQFLNELVESINEQSGAQLRFALTRDVKAPARGTSLSAGYDFFLPNDYGCSAEQREPQKLVIQPGQSALVSTGVHVSFPKEYVLIGFNKSGVASKFKLLIGAQVIDADYQGEVHINLHNVGKSAQTFEPGAKLTQFILLKVGLLETEQADSVETLYNGEETDRGTGGFGSTGM